MTDLNIFTKRVKELIFYLDDIGGKKLYQTISAAVLKNISSDIGLQQSFISLRFLMIPFLSTREIAELLKNNLITGLKLEELDIVERISKKLIFLDINDRDNCKKALKEAVVQNKEIITKRTANKDNKELSIIMDWIKDYVGQVGVGKQTLGKAQYLYQKPYFIKLEDIEKELLKKLFALYDFLNASSLTPEGFEDDLLLKTVDGKLITTNRGQVVVLYDPQKEKIKQMANSNANNLKDLNSMLTQYPPNSLERKAVEEEIKKLTD